MLVKLEKFRFLLNIFIAVKTIFGNTVVGVARGGKEVMTPQKFLENIVILCFKRRFSKQNSVIRLKSNILPLPNFFPPLNFWAGYTTEHCVFYAQNNFIKNPQYYETPYASQVKDTQYSLSVCWI